MGETGVLIRRDTKCLGNCLFRIMAQIVMFSCQRHSPQKEAAEVNGQGAPLPLASLDSNHCIKTYWAGQTLAYLQSQANEKYASAAEPGASLLHGTAFLS